VNGGLRAAFFLPYAGRAYAHNLQHSIPRSPALLGNTNPTQSSRLADLYNDRMPPRPSPSPRFSLRTSLEKPTPPPRPASLSPAPTQCQPQYLPGYGPRLDPRRSPATTQARHLRRPAPAFIWIAGLSQGLFRFDRIPDEQRLQILCGQQTDRVRGLLGCRPPASRGGRHRRPKPTSTSSPMASPAKTATT